MRKLFTILIMLCATMTGVIQAKDLERFYIRGYVTGIDYQLLDSVEVSLMKDDTIKVPFKVLSKVKGSGPDITTGQMRILVESGLGNYTLSLFKDGYTPYVKGFKIASVSEEIKYLDMLIISKGLHRELNEVSVTATRLKMVMKGDTLVYDASAFRLAEGSMLDALVRQLPGASIDDDGVITVNGRKMKELLINGKDFFKGDPKVALQNLPSYAVKDIRVYDKADDDAYLTKSNAKLSRNEEEENMVMDVMLKKDYNAGWMGNMEIGYGTEDRYRGRLFAMGYTKNLRVSLFGNLNNVGDNETASSDGRWHSSGNATGVIDRQKGGLDYTYDDSKRVRASGNITVNHHDQKVYEMVSATNLYPTGNIYSRSISMKNERVTNLATDHKLQYKGDNAYFRMNANLNWDVNNNNTNNRQANFTTSPQESNRGEAIEDLFARRFEGIYSKNMLTALHTRQNYHGTSLKMGLSSQLTIRPKTWKGMLYITASASHNNSPFKNHTLYEQIIGPMGDQDAEPQNSNRFSPVTNRSSSASGSVTYRHQWRKFNDKHTHTYDFNLGLRYNFDQGRDSTDYFMNNIVGDMSILPSMTMPDNMTHVWENTHYNRTLTNSFRQAVNIQYTLEPTAPGDSTFNAMFNTYFSAVVTEKNERMSYDKPTLLNERVRRPSTLGYGSINFNLSSQNKVRYMGVSVSHSISMTSPSLMYLVNTVDNSDPFNITYGNPSGLSNAITHRTTVSFSRFARGAHRCNLYWDFHYNSTNNAIAMARSYNPATGVSTSRPENIKGNWNIDSYFQLIPSFGKRDQWQFYTIVYGHYRHDVDYLGLNVEPTPSVIRNYHLHNVLRLTYQIDKIGSVTVSTTNGIDHAKYPSDEYENLTTHSHNFGLSTSLNLPYNFEVNTGLNVNMNRGYTDKAMNVTQWIWNASVGKNFMKGKLGAKLSAYDILKSARSINTRTTAQSVTERWVNTLPRYVMLTLSYRLDVKPSKGGHNGPSRW